MAWMSRALAQLEFLTCKTRKGPAGLMSSGPSVWASAPGPGPFAHRL